MWLVNNVFLWPPGPDTATVTSRQATTVKTVYGEAYGGVTNITLRAT